MNDKKDHLYKLRHSAEHVLHQAVKELYPQILLAMGPATDDGFYFDFDNRPEGKEAVTITEADFPKIEKRMREIIDKNIPITRHEMSVAEARNIFKNNQYKMEWVEQAEKRGDVITVYWTGKPGEKGSMVDLCAGPHVGSTGEIKAFKLLSVAGAYWHGSEKNKMLTRIYGTAFGSQKELDEHLNLLGEARKRDHRKLGKELGLFTFSDMVGKGLPLFTAKGATIWRELERYVVDEEIKHGYEHVRTPNLAKTELYKKSGHYPYYKDTMYPAMKIDEEELILRPMTCPHHFALYMDKPRSYRELPMRLAEMARLYRYEKSGELTGLIRVREFTLADAHNFVRKEQAAEEVGKVLDLIEKIAGVLGLKKGSDYVYRLSLGDRENKEKYYDSPENWEYGEKLLRVVLEQRKAPYYEAKDEAAFYGPKIDVQMKNVLGKEDTAFTVQYDFCLPERFGLSFRNEKGVQEQPIVIHRSSVGALERSIGFLIERYAGVFPLWLSPVQVGVIPVSDQVSRYAQEVHTSFIHAGIRSELNCDNKTLGAKIRDFTLQKVPYLCIIGASEEKRAREEGKAYVSVRTREGENRGLIALSEFLAELTKHIEKKA